MSAPYLLLAQQMMNDLFEVLNKLYKDQLPIFKFFICSSDTYKKYSNNTEIDAFSWNDIEDELFKSKQCNIAIVASCHKSLNKFVDRITNGKFKSKKCTIVSYIDESHLISLNKKINEDCEDKTYVKLNALCQNSTHVYALSATPNPIITRTINNYSSYKDRDNYDKDRHYIYVMSPAEAIQLNLIVAPYVFFTKTDASKIDARMLIDILSKAKKHNENISHKILVSLYSCDDVEFLYKQLEKYKNEYNYEIFYNDSIHNTNKLSNDVNIPDDEDIMDFSNRITKCEKDCFILHIRKLTAGIDIKCITDCVIWSNSHVNVSIYRKIIQTIGRATRTLDGERGVDITNRIKKDCGVFFITNKEDDEIEKSLTKFVINYYGIDYVYFCENTVTPRGTSQQDLPIDIVKINKSTAWDQSIIKELIINIEEYIQHYVGTVLYFNKSVGYIESKETIINDITEEYYRKYYKDSVYNGTSELLYFEYDNIRKIICKYFENHNIDI